jgi:hypothetical protein
MAGLVYAWPPVAAIGSEWTPVQPVDESFSGITNKRYASANQPERRATTVVAAALGRGNNGAGYMEMLKRLLQGGAHYVRLTSYPINWAIEARTDLQSQVLTWLDGATDMVWLDGSTDMIWLDGTVINSTLSTSKGLPALTLTGCPPSTLVVRPAEFLTVINPTTGATDTVQSLAPAYSNSEGIATVRLYRAAAFAGRVNIGTADTAVFRVVGALPRAVQPLSGQWSYTWSFEEVMPEDVGGFVENLTWFEAT